MSTELKITRLQGSSFAEYSRLREVFDLVNRVFMDSFKKNPRVIKPTGLRFDSVQQMVEEIGPNAIMFVMSTEKLIETSSDGEGTIIAIAGYKPWASNPLVQKRYDEERRRVLGAIEMSEEQVDLKPKQDLGHNRSENTQVDDDDHAQSLCLEVINVVVEPAWQKHGLASQLLQAITEEINEKPKALPDDHQKIRLFVRTAKEINEDYWARKGFRTCGVRFFEPGMYGSEDGFHIVDMSRELAIT